MTDPQNSAPSDDSQRASDANPYDSIRAEGASESPKASPYGELPDGAGDHDRHAQSGSPYGQAQAGNPDDHQPGSPDRDAGTSASSESPASAQQASPYGEMRDGSGEHRHAQSGSPYGQAQAGNPDNHQPGSPDAGRPQGSPYGQAPGQQHTAQQPQGSPYGQAPGQQPQGSPYGQAPGQQHPGQPPQGSSYGQAPGQQHPGQPGAPYGQQHYAQQQFGHQPHAGAPGAPGAMYSFETDKQVGMFAHLLNIVGVFGPLIIWLVTKDKGPLANSEGKEATNFGITAALAQAASWVLITVLSFIGIGFLFGFLSLAISIAVIVFAIIGGLHVNNTGTPYRYPINIRFIK